MWRNKVFLWLLDWINYFLFHWKPFSRYTPQFWLTVDPHENLTSCPENRIPRIHFCKIHFQKHFFSVINEMTVSFLSFHPFSFTIFNFRWWRGQTPEENKKKGTSIWENIVSSHFLFQMWRSKLESDCYCEKTSEHLRCSGGFHKCVFIQF